MRNKEKEEVALVNIDRNPLILLISTAISSILGYLSYTFVLYHNPWGFILFVPAAFLSFQTIWLILTPFAMIFENKLEIKRSIFSNKMLFFVDIKKIEPITKNKLIITYTDDEVTKMSLFGIKSSQSETLRSELEKHVAKVLNARL